MKFITGILFFFSTTAFSQNVQLLDSASHASLRGLSVVNDRVVWASGSDGMVGRSVDSGNTWKWVQVKGFGKTDFRDIEAFNDAQAVIMGIGEPALILRTIDGGEHWKVVYENKLPGMFLDAMEFWNEQSGIVIGDPLEGKFFVARTFDGGNSWRPVPPGYMPDAENGEACFAASGTNIREYKKDAATFVTGGMHSRIFIQNQRINLPLAQGTETSGANSLAVKNTRDFVVVGGDFSKPDDSTGVCAISRNGGKTWAHPIRNPGGYRSCVEFLNGKTWLTCGLNGVDISKDDGVTWDTISTEGFHVCRKAKDGEAVFLAGSDGRIARLSKRE